MIYLHRNNTTNILSAYGSMVALSNHTGLSIHVLTYYFTRKKVKVYHDNDNYIVKTEIIRSKNG